MHFDDMEMEMEMEMDNEATPGIDTDSEIINTTEPSDEWTLWRQNMAQEMWNIWHASRQV